MTPVLLFGIAKVDIFSEPANFSKEFFQKSRIFADDLDSRQIRMTDRRYISVILPLKLEWEPCYALPQGMEASVGDRVKVVFAGKEYSGVVSGTDIIPETEHSKIKEIVSVDKDLSRIHPEEIRLWKMVSDYYLCSIGEVLKAAYPLGKINLEEAHSAAVHKIQVRRERVLESMRQKIARLEERLDKKEVLLSKTKDGTKAKVRYIEDICRIKADLSAAETALANMVSGNETPEEAPHTYVPLKNIELSNTQNSAFEDIKRAFADGMPVHIHGVTGSGKTEIYMKLAQEALSKGKNVLYLVPEISLSRQLEERLSEHFGSRLMVFHSAETAARRRDIAEAIRSDKSGYIVLGTRSSLFLPHHNLGLIIVDEEHDSSYKQDSPAPRYNGRDTALMLAVIHEADTVLGSATPSLEEMYNCRYGRHVSVSLTEKYHGSENADIEIIDTKAERKKRGMRGSFSIKLIEHIDRTLREGHQVVILRSRRSYSPALQCSECGELQKCPHCNVSRSLHEHGGRETMVCHHCGWTAAYDGRCRHCYGGLTSLGAGTQKIEEEAAALFPNARTARLDSDSAQNKTFEAQTIKDFSEGRIDILIGTQIISKGFDFSNLKLVVVIAADTLLAVQDFRADEKAVQTLEQLRGRCGRRAEKGMFIIQTSQPGHPVYQRLTDNRPLEDMLEERREFGFPPYTRMIEIIIRDRFEDRLERLSGELTQTLRSLFDPSDTNTVTGPYSPAVDRIADQHIRMIRLNLKKDKRLSSLKQAIKSEIQSFEKKNKYDGHVTINVDPA